MLRFRMQVAGAAAIDRGIARCAGGLDDYRPLWPVIEDRFYALENALFRTEGAAAGSAWKPLSEKYARWKEAHFSGQPVLQRTGDLMKSLTNPHDANAVRIQERNTLTLGSRIPYAVYHQAGTSKMPPRPAIQFSEEFQRAVSGDIRKYLEQLAQAGFEHG
jgi:phage gpG-like protein